MHFITHPNRIGNARFQPGFTLVELMVTVAVAAILMSLAIPSFARQLKEWQRDSATKAFTSHVQMARSEAIKSSRRVVMCSSSDGKKCAGSAEWATGWLSFLDANGDGDMDDGEPLLISRGAPTGLASMQASGSVQSLSFLPNGLMASNMTTFKVVPSGSSQIKRNEVTVNRIGRVYVKATDQGT